MATPGQPQVETSNFTTPDRKPEPKTPTAPLKVPGKRQVMVSENSPRRPSDIVVMDWVTLFGPRAPPPSPEAQPPTGDVLENGKGVEPGVNP